MATATETFKLLAAQGMDAMMIKMFGHTDFELIMKTYYAPKRRCPNGGGSSEDLVRPVGWHIQCC